MGGIPCGIGPEHVEGRELLEDNYGGVNREHTTVDENSSKTKVQNSPLGGPHMPGPIPRPLPRPRIGPRIFAILLCVFSEF